MVFVLSTLQFAPYCASKWAVEGLSKSIAKELPEGMTIVALDPGIIYTDMLVSCLGDFAPQYQSPKHWYDISLIITLLYCYCNVMLDDWKMSE